jgi:hypothetical protein
MFFGLLEKRPKTTVNYDVDMEVLKNDIDIWISFFQKQAELNSIYSTHYIYFDVGNNDKNYNTKNSSIQCPYVGILHGIYTNKETPA